MKTFGEHLTSSALAHGHLCPGQVVGVRMALLGCRLVDLDAPRHREQVKKLIVYVEMDRCTADAVAHVTGAKLGRRSLKFVDYGIMAATFVNLKTMKAYRIISTEEARDLSPFYARGSEGKSAAQVLAYLRMPDSVLFRVQSVQVKIGEFDLPGPTRRKTTCSRCGQVVRDAKEILVEGAVLCRPCAHGAYFEHPREVTWPDMNWVPEPFDLERIVARNPEDHRFRVPEPHRSNSEAYNRRDQIH